MATRQIVSIRVGLEGAGEVTASARTISGAIAGIGGAAKGVGAAAADLSAFRASTDQAAGGADRLAGALGRVAHYGAGGLLGLASISQVVGMADAMTNLHSRLALVSTGLGDVGRAQATVFAIAQDTRQSLEATADVYIKLAKGGEAMGLSQKRVAGLTRTVSAAMALSGASAQASQAALMQFGQALSSGVLRGEELNSVMEQAPALAEALAKGLGVAVGELRALGETGALSVTDLVAALEKSAPHVAAQFASLAPTIGGALTQLGNATTQLVGDMDNVVGASGKVAGSVKFVADHIESFGTVAAAVGAVALGGLVSRLAAAVAAKQAAGIAARAASADFAQLAASVGLVETRAVGAGVALRGASAVVGALGGPIGVLITGLSLAATAWAVFGNSAETAGQQAFDAKQALDKLNLQKKFGQGDLGTARRQLAETDGEWEDAVDPHVIDRLMTRRGELQRYIAAAEALEKESVTRISATWGSLHQTKAQQRAEEIVALDKKYVAETAANRANAAAQLRLAEEYHVKLGVIEKKYAEKGRAGRVAPKSDLQKMLELGEKNLAASRAAEFSAADDDEEARLGANKRAMESARLSHLEAAALTRRAEAIKDGIEPLRVLARQIDEVNTLRAAGELTAGQAVAQEAKLTAEFAKSREALLDLKKTGKDSFEGIKDAIENMGNKAADTFAEFVVTGKASFSDLINSMLRDIARVQAKKIMDPITGGATDWLLKLVGGGGSAGGAGSMSGNGSVQGNADYIWDLHSGGIAGAGEGSGRHLRNRTLFAGAPKFHGGGLAGDEMPAILKKGEGVFTPGQMKALGGGQSAPAINLNVNVNVRNEAASMGVGTTATVTQNAQGGVDVNLLVRREISGDLATNGPISRAFAATFGLKRPAYA